jgi:outer membrane protein OmpA-like peptidoglycan-associated protein
MVSRTSLCSIVTILMLCSAKSNGQDGSAGMGVGGTFGMISPLTDIERYQDNPAGRAFIRFYPSETFAIEAGAGMGRLEASANGKFFTTLIYPIDVRLVLQPVKESEFQPFAFAGIGFLVFDPRDSRDRLLPRNANKEYGKTTSYIPIGVGGEYYVTDNAAFGLTASYNLTMTDNLDDIELDGNDNYWGVGIQLFGFLTSRNNDLDGDGLLNDEEKRLGTDPLNPDTDGDKLRDGEEVFKYRTNPLDPDSDDDGLEDGYEVQTIYELSRGLDELLFGGIQGLNVRRILDLSGVAPGPRRDGPAFASLGDAPLAPTRQDPGRVTTDPLNPDTDGDGLLDGEEVNSYRTHPLKTDTDGDGLTDGDEVKRYRTDPTRVDTDGDGLSDGDEVLRHRTNPLVADTDKGGVPDGREIQMGLNPLDSADDVPIIAVGERIILEGVNFETNKATLLPGAKAILDQVANSLLANPDAEVAIHGHTDNVGGAKYNQELSLRRAESVKDYLAGLGVSGSRMTTRGYGFTKPIADNGTAQGRAKNRRIEFVRIK